MTEKLRVQKSRNSLTPVLWSTGQGIGSLLWSLVLSHSEALGSSSSVHASTSSQAERKRKMTCLAGLYQPGDLCLDLKMLSCAVWASVDGESHLLFPPLVPLGDFIQYRGCSQGAGAFQVTFVYSSFKPKDKPPLNSCTAGKENLPFKHPKEAIKPSW